MGGYKTVVVGTDGSASSMIAVDRAAELAQGPDSRLILVTAFIHEADRVLVLQDGATYLFGTREEVMAYFTTRGERSPVRPLRSTSHTEPALPHNPRVAAVRSA